MALHSFLSICDTEELVPYIHLHLHFYPSEEFIEILKGIFLEHSDLRPKIALLLQRWVSLRFRQDFFNNKSLMDQLIGFGKLLDQHIPLMNFSYQNKFKLSLIQGVNNIKKRRTEREKKYVSVEDFKISMRETEIARAFVWGLVWGSTSEIAEQLLLVDWEYFQPIECYELISNTWKKLADSGVAKYVHFFNRLAHFVASFILSENDPEVREKLVCRFIALAEECREKRNYNAVMAVLAGLNLHPVSRLGKLWDAIPKKLSETKEKLDALMDPRGNYRAYRAAIAHHTATHSFVIPYFGIYLRDLLFIEEGNSVKTTSGEVNRERTKLMAGVLKEIHSLQQQKLSHKYEPDDLIYRFIKNLQGCSETNLDNLSYGIQASRARSETQESEISKSVSSSSLASDESNKPEPESEPSE